MSDDAYPIDASSHAFLWVSEKQLVPLSCFKGMFKRFGYRYTVASCLFTLQM